MSTSQGYDFGLDNVRKLVKIIFDEDAIVANENARALFIRCRDAFRREKVAALDAYHDSYRSPWLSRKSIRRVVAAGIPCEQFGDSTHFVTCLATAIRFVTHQTRQHRATTWSDETVMKLGSQNNWANAIMFLALELDGWDGNEDHLSSIQRRLFEDCKNDPLDRRVVLESVMLDYQLLKGYTIHDRGFCNFCLASSELGMPTNRLAVNPRSDQIGWWSTIFQDYFGARENIRRMKCEKGHTFNYLTHTVQGDLPEHLFSTPEKLVPGRFSTPRSILFSYTSNRKCIDFACYNWLGTLVEDHEGSHCLYWGHEEKKNIFKFSPSKSYKFFEVPIGDRDVNDAILFDQLSTEILVIFERQGLMGVKPKDMALRCPISEETGSAKGPGLSSVLGPSNVSESSKSGPSNIGDESSQATRLSNVREQSESRKRPRSRSSTPDPSEIIKGHGVWLSGDVGS